MRIAVFVGTRPEALKLAPVVLALQKIEGVEASVVSTGQHQLMLDSALSIFDIEPNVRLKTFQASQSLGSLGSAILKEVDEYLRESDHDLVFVHGDTSTASFSALAAFYNKVPVAHIEAGLRTGNLGEPFPEELNRKSIGLVARDHLAPTATARSNLLAEGVADDTICVTGNTLVDSVRLVSGKYFSDPHWVGALEIKVRESIFSEVGRCPFALVTLHRRENHGKTLLQYLGVVKALALKNPQFHFIFPVHPNPAVSDASRKLLTNLPNVHLTDPLDYLTFLWLLSQSAFIISDSGGVQEEAVTFGKDLLLCRAVTERPEAVTDGGVKIIGPNFSRLAELSQTLIGEAGIHGYEASRPELSANPFGDGHAAERSVDFSLARF